ncbi:MAG: TetR/AcrR family transcriptional regulator [Alphaproteobacteria bacterium]|nr:TetR/AcrR family transcriptional regulator [Alphaproteobacteria bacterium]
MASRSDSDGGVVVPKQARSRETVRAILHAARVVANEADEEPTVSRIAAVSGVAPGSIYRFFRSKDQIFAELTQELLDELLRELDALLAAHADADPQVRTHAVVSWICACFERNQRLFAVLRDVAGRLDLDDRLTRARLRIVDVVSRSLARHMGMPLTTAEHRAFVMVMACSGVLVAHRAEARDPVPDDVLRDELEHLFGPYVSAA